MSDLRLTCPETMCPPYGCLCKDATIANQKELLHAKTQTIAGLDADAEGRKTLIHEMAVKIDSLQPPVNEHGQTPLQVRITELDAVVITLHKQRADMYKRIDEQDATIARLKAELTLYHEGAIVAGVTDSKLRKLKAGIQDVVNDVSPLDPKYMVGYGMVKMSAVHKAAALLEVAP